MNQNKDVKLVEDVEQRFDEMFTHKDAWGGEELLFLNEGNPEAVKQFLAEEINKAVEAKETEIIKLRSDLAHAIGFCKGLGHPEAYLEKNYPELVEEKI